MKHCAYCGNQFEPARRGAAGDAVVFCSRQCVNKARVIKRRLRFEQKYERRGHNECWIWNAANDGRGYGRIDLDSAHRVSYEEYVGAIPKDKFVLHKCDNPACVNPAHLELGTQNKNMNDASMRERFNRKLSGHDVEEILKCHGEPLKVLAGRYNVSLALISQIRRGLKWKHLTNRFHDQGEASEMVDDIESAMILAEVGQQ